MFVQLHIDSSFLLWCPIVVVGPDQLVANFSPCSFPSEQDPGTHSSAHYLIESLIMLVVNADASCLKKNLHRRCNDGGDVALCIRWVAMLSFCGSRHHARGGLGCLSACMAPDHLNLPPFSVANLFPFLHKNATLSLLALVI